MPGRMVLAASRERGGAQAWPGVSWSFLKPNPDGKAPAFGENRGDQVQ